MPASAPLQCTSDLRPPTGDLLVLDTNAVLDGWLFQDPAMHAVVAALGRGQLRWTATSIMLEELRDVLCRPLASRWEPARAALRAREPWTWAQRVATPKEGHWASRGLRSSDPDDQPFIDLALSLPARWLVSRDRALLRLAKPALLWGVRVLTPAELSAVLAAG